MRTFLSIAAAMFAFANGAHADIFQWEYINPADPNQGKQQSTVLAPDGAGVDAVPGADLSYRNLTMAYLISADLTSANASYVNLTDAYGPNANFTEADLTNANFTRATFWGGTFTGADFSDVEIRDADFTKFRFLDEGGQWVTYGTGITLAQLYSTSSYQVGDMSGVKLRTNNLDGGNFAGQNLTAANFEAAKLFDVDFSQTNVSNASFHSADLTGANFTSADVRGANFGHFHCPGEALCTSPIPGTGITLEQLYSTESYQAHDLRGIDLSANYLAGGDFTGQNVTNASFSFATLTDADFTGAEIRGANFQQSLYESPRGLSLAQLYTTASYQAHDLAEINLGGNILVGGNFAGQNLTNANFDDAMLAGADFTASDARGAFLYLQYQSDVITTNLILPDGHINGLDLDAGGLLVVRDHDGNPRDLYGYPVSPIPIPITVDQHMKMGLGGTLSMVFDGDAWDSTISFAPGIPVTLGGTLELTFADGVNLASQLGRTFDIFDWTGVTPTGAFAVSSLYTWDLSNLYTTGEVTLTAVPEPATVCLVVAAAFCGRRLRRRFRAISRLDKIGNALSGSENPPTRFFLQIAAMFPLLAFASAARADIFQWEYINPAEPDQGKRPSTTLAPGGAGVDTGPGAYLAGRDLTMAYLVGANLVNADFGSKIEVQGSKWIEYPWGFEQIRFIDFRDTRLSDADFTGAEVRGADFSTGYCPSGTVCSHYWPWPGSNPGAGLTLTQLYSTASYQSGDLRGVRGLDLSDAITTNLILPDGRIDGLDLNASGMLVVRDYEDPRIRQARVIPITVDQNFVLGPGSTLGMEFEADAWDSTISFAPGIPATLGGTLELTFAADVNLASQVGRTFHLFDWTGVTPTGAFAISSPYAWDLSRLYTTGEVTLTAIPEPTTFALAAVSAFSLTLFRRRKIS